MRYAVYVLKSIKDDTRYVGITGKDVKERWRDHDNGSNQYTKVHTPFALLYYEIGYCKSCALKREKFFKSGQGRKLLDLIDN